MTDYKPMIPAHRPVTGADLDAVRQQMGLPMADAIWLYGISPNKWSKMVRMHPNEPVSDPTLALFVRFLDKHPELALFPRWPQAREMFDFLNETQKISREDFSLQLGYERTAATRWFNALDLRQTAALSRLLYCIRETMLPMDKRERGQLMDELRATALQEASARKVNLLKTGRWTAAANDENKPDELEAEPE